MKRFLQVLNFEFSLRIWQLVSKTQWRLFLRSCDSTCCHDVISPPGRWSRRWAGSEFGAGTGSGPAVPRPGSTPRPRSRRGTAASAGRRCSFPCRRVTSPGRSWEGCPTCRTSAASRRAEPRNSAEEEESESSFNFWTFKNLLHELQNKGDVSAGCSCEYLSGPSARRRRAGVGPDDGVPAEHDSELVWRTGSYLLVQQRRENTWTNDKEDDSPSNITLTGTPINTLSIHYQNTLNSG